MKFVEKVKGFLMEPSKTFDSVKEETLGEATKYFVVIWAVYSAMFAIFIAFIPGVLGPMMGFGSGLMSGMGAGIGLGIFMFVALMFLGIIGVFVGGAVYHIFVYIVGGRKGIGQTIKAIMYGSTPLLFGWIPLINIIAGIWSLIIEIVGVRQLHGISTGRAIIAIVLVPVVIGIIIILLAIMAAFIFAVGP